MRLIINEPRFDDFCKFRGNKFWVQKRFADKNKGTQSVEHAEQNLCKELIVTLNYFSGSGYYCIIVACNSPYDGVIGGSKIHVYVNWGAFFGDNEPQ